MLFNSFTFLLFFICVLIVHSLPFPWRLRKFNLLVASYVFYAAWDLRFVLFLLYATATNWLAGRLLTVWDQFTLRRRVVLWLTVLLNIGLLCAFKYGNELLGALQWLGSFVSLRYETPRIRILLPVGLSFFTFQALSYTIDIYRRTIKPASSILDFAIFVSFFPVLLAGPLLRAGPFLSQCAVPRRASDEQFGSGVALITLGLFLKVSLADNLLSPVVQQVFDPKFRPDALSAWVGTIAFAAQDYCDFAGYSTCAMGVGLCLGFILPENFRAPFSSVGFRDLWQRWHITLVAWMRDYVFNSLGGVYKGYLRAAINVMIVMLLIGLWHGAAWTYVIFGLLHGCYLIGETILQRSSLRGIRFWRGASGTCVLWLVTMMLCCVAFVFYRSETLEQSCRLLSAMVGAVYATPVTLSEYHLLITVVVVESLIIAHWLCRNEGLDKIAIRAPWWVSATCLGLMLLAISVSSVRRKISFISTTKVIRCSNQRDQSFVTCDSLGF